MILVTIENVALKYENTICDLGAGLSLIFICTVRLVIALNRYFINKSLIFFHKNHLYILFSSYDIMYHVYKQFAICSHIFQFRYSRIHMQIRKIFYAFCRLR